MYTIKLDVNDIIYDKVMFFLKSIPIKNMVIERTDDIESKKQDDIVGFFQSSPFTGEVSLERESEKYTDRITF